MRKENHRRLASHMTGTAGQQVPEVPLEPWLLEHGALEGAQGYSRVRKKKNHERPCESTLDFKPAIDNYVVAINPQRCIDRLLWTCLVSSAV